MATKNENPAPFMAVHPGMMIKPELEERGITQKEFARMLGMQASHMSEVLRGKRTLSAELALKMEKAIGIPAKTLLNAQTQYELETAGANAVPKDNELETVAVTIPVKDRSLLQELVRKFGWACMF
jgi:addiction module HigA family antidote